MSSVQAAATGVTGVTGVTGGTAGPGAAAPGPAPARRRSRFDLMARRVLLVPEVAPARGRDVHRLFSTGILLSALRCLLSYVFLPIVAPLLGVAAGVGPSIGLPLALVALGFDVVGLRRFFVADHPRRWQMAAIYLAVMGLVVALAVIDVVELLR